jgi:hypothetical protein
MLNAWPTLPPTLRAVTPQGIRGVVDALLAEARGGNVQAIRELLDRTLGKPVELDLLERIARAGGACR